MDNLPPDQLGGHAPQPRYCFIIKRPDFSGYGFNLHAEKSRPGQFIGKVDENSPAEIAGLREGDRIVEVNGINISQENHKQVVQRIKAVPNETKLLVVDKIADEYYKKINVMVKSSMPNVLVRSSEDEAISSSGKPEVNGNNNNNNFQEAVVPVVSSEKNMEDIINNAGVQDTSDGGHHHRIKTSPSSRSSSSSVEKGQQILPPPPDPPAYEDCVIHEGSTPPNEMKVPQQVVTLAEVIVENNATENGISEEPFEEEEEEKENNNEPLDSLEPIEIAAVVNENKTTIHAEITPLPSPSPSSVHSTTDDVVGPEISSKNDEENQFHEKIENEDGNLVKTTTFDLPPSTSEQLEEISRENENNDDQDLPDDLIEKNNNNVENSNLTGEVITESVNENEEIQEISTRFEEPIEVNVQTVITDNESTAEMEEEEENFQDKTEVNQLTGSADDNVVNENINNESKKVSSPPKYEFRKDTLETDENHNNKLASTTVDEEIKPTEVVLPPMEKPMSLTSDDGSSTRTTPSPVPLNRSDSDRTDWDGLNLSLTAREMRERIGSRKKSDPRREKLDMRKKYEIIQTL